LPSRIAAMRVIEHTRPTFVNRDGMYEWLRSEEIADLTGRPSWPTPETADLWKRFRSAALAGHLQKWASQDWTMNGPFSQEVNPMFLGRIVVDEASGEASITTPDYKHITGIEQRLRQDGPGLLQVNFADDRGSAQIVRLGHGKARWVSPT